MPDPFGGQVPARRVEKPWGSEIWFVVTERYAGKILHIEGGEELSLQYHRRKDEAVWVLSGELELELEAGDGKLESHRLGPGEGRRIPPGRRHRMRALSTVEICEVSTPDLDDVVRLEDRYGRAGTSDG